MKGIESVAQIRTTAERAGIVAGFHCQDGQAAKRRLAEGFNLATAGGDLTDLELSARSQLGAARGA